MDAGSGDFSARARNPPLYNSIAFQCFKKHLIRKHAYERQFESEFVWACFGESDVPCTGCPVSSSTSSRSALGFSKRGLDQKLPRFRCQ